MLKREGNPLHQVQGSGVRLTDEQLAACNAAFQTIEGDLAAMKPVREAVSRLAKPTDAINEYWKFKNARARENAEQFSSEPEIPDRPSRLTRPA